MCDFDKRLELGHLSNLPNVTFHLQDLFSKEADATVAEVVSGSGGDGVDDGDGVDGGASGDGGGGGSACIIVGIHLCGELSRRAIQLWRGGGAAALVMSPCCLPRRRRHDVFGEDQGVYIFSAVHDSTEAIVSFT